MKTGTIAAAATAAMMFAWTPCAAVAEDAKAAPDAPEFVRADGKTTLALFTGSDWCIWCKRLEKEVLSTDEFKKALEKDYALEVFDFPSDKSKIDKETAKRNRRMQKRFGVKGFPTVIAFDAAGKRLCNLGYRKGGPAAWLAYAKEEISLSGVIATHFKPYEDEFDALDSASYAAFEKVSEKKAGKEALAKPLADMKDFASRLEKAEMPESLAKRKADLLEAARHVINALENIDAK